MDLTENEEKIIKYLTGKRFFTSPTVIGRMVGGRSKRGFIRHSAWASPICKCLVEKGLLERNEKGWYKVK